MCKQNRLVLIAMALVMLVVYPLGAFASGNETTISGAVAQIIPLIGKTPEEVGAALGIDAPVADDSGMAALANAQELLREKFDAALLFDTGAGTLYGIRYSHAAESAEQAVQIANGIIAQLNIEYGAPDTYSDGMTAKAPEATDYEALAQSTNEYWYFARPQHLTATVRIYGDAQTGYNATLTYALSIARRVTYALGDEAAQYIDMMGMSRADVYATLGDIQGDAQSSADDEVAVGSVQLMDFSAARSLMFDADALCGVKYDFEVGDVEAAASAVFALMNQATQEYGAPDAAEDGVDAIVLGNIAQQLGEGNCSMSAHWKLPTADGLLAGFQLALDVTIDESDAPKVSLTYKIAE